MAPELSILWERSSSFSSCGNCGRPHWRPRRKGLVIGAMEGISLLWIPGENYHYQADINGYEEARELLW
jgi:hypothetical protein